MDLKERFSIINNHMESIKTLSQLFGAKDKYESMMSTKQLAEEQLAQVTGINNAKMIELGKEVESLQKERELESEEIRSLLLKYSDNNEMYVNCDDEICKSTIESAIESYTMLEELNANIFEFEKTIKEQEEELIKVTKEYGDIQSLLKENLSEILCEKHSQQVHDSVRDQLQALSDALTLKPVIELYKEIGTRNTKLEYRDKGRRQQVIKKYLLVLQKLKIKTSLTPFLNHDIENFISEENVCDNDLVLYAIIKYMAGKTFTSSKFLDGMFTIQLAINMYQLFTNTMTEENKTEFVKSLNELSKLFV